MGESGRDSFACMDCMWCAHLFCSADVLGCGVYIIYSTLYTYLPSVVSREIRLLFPFVSVRTCHSYARLSKRYKKDKLVAAT